MQSSYSSYEVEYNLQRLVRSTSTTSKGKDEVTVRTFRFISMKARRETFGIKWEAV